LRGIERFQTICGIIGTAFLKVGKTVKGKKGEDARTRLKTNGERGRYGDVRVMSRARGKIENEKDLKDAHYDPGKSYLGKQGSF